MTVLLFKEDIIGLDVPVDDCLGASIVQHIQGFGNLNEAMPDEVLRKPSRVRNSMLQVSSSAVLEPLDQIVIGLPGWFERESMQLDDPSAAGKDVL